jgi:ABC-type nitrate/sulfonate/bicarbonate transport system substrate-binding protein
MEDSMRRLTLHLLLAAALAAGLASRASAQDTVRLAVLAPSALLWLHAIADSKGFYKERGIQVQELRSASSPALLQAVSSGSADAGVSLGDVVIRAIDQGAPVIISGSILEKTILRLYGSPGVTDAKQLAGKPVTAGAVQGGTANLLKYQAMQLGVDHKGLQMVSIPNSRDRVIAMKNGQVAGALLIAPYDSLVERDGMKLLDVYREPYVQTPLILNTSWAKANPKAAVGITQAMRQAADWIYDPKNRTEAAAILAAYTKQPQDISEASYDFVVKEQQAIGKGLRVQAAGLENIVKIDRLVTGATGAAPAFDLRKYFDPSYLEAK